MTADPSLFVFGHLATPEHLADEARRNLAGLFHGGRIEPDDPAPGQDVQLLIDAGSEAALDCVTVRYTANPFASPPDWSEVPAQMQATRWDDLAWRYVDRWIASIPGQPNGAQVRYLIEGHSSVAGTWMNADNRVPDAGPEIFGYTVDNLSSPSWVHDAVIYQIFVDRFAHERDDSGRPLAHGDEVYGGTLDGITARLDYLTALGINVLWLTPIFPSETYHGYDALDYEEVAGRVGGDAALRRLTAAAHARGIRLLLDFAANHCSWHNRMFLDAQQRRESRYRDWFTFDRWPDQYSTFFHARYLPQLNTANPEVVDYLSGVAASYLTDFGVDGFRLDYVLGPSLHFWSEFHAFLRRVKPDAYTVGEATTGPGELRKYQGRLDGCLDFPLLHAFRRFFLQGDMDARAFHSFVHHGETFFDRGFTRPTFLDNHDMNRFLWAARGDVRKLKLAAVCQFTLPQPPIIYYGTEVGLSQETDLADVGMAAARLPMLWDDRQDRHLLDFYRTIIRARRDHSALRYGRRTVLAARGGVYAYSCEGDGDRVIVALNNSPAVQTVSLDEVEGLDLLSQAGVRGSIPFEPFQAAMIVPSNA